MKNFAPNKKYTRLQATQWADRALAAVYAEADAAPKMTLVEACERAWHQAAAAWVDAERRTGRPAVP